MGYTADQSTGVIPGRDANTEKDLLSASEHLENRNSINFSPKGGHKEKIMRAMPWLDTWEQAKLEVLRRLKSTIEAQQTAQGRDLARLDIASGDRRDSASGQETRVEKASDWLEPLREAVGRNQDLNATRDNLESDHGASSSSGSGQVMPDRGAAGSDRSSSSG